jgi:hypothetical protein
MGVHASGIGMKISALELLKSFNASIHLALPGLCYCPVGTPRWCLDVKHCNRTTGLHGFQS